MIPPFAKTIPHCSVPARDSLLITGASSYGLNTHTGSKVSISPAKDTNYTVTALQPNGCVVRDTHTRFSPQHSTESLGNDTSICIHLELDTGAGFKKYQWSTGALLQQIIASEAGAYYVSAIDNKGCMARDTLQIINVFSIPVINMGNDTSLCQDEVMSLDAGPGFISYSWNTGDISRGIVAENTGIYVVNAVDKNHCRASNSLTIVSILQTSSINVGNDTMICQRKKIH